MAIFLELTSYSIKRKSPGGTVWVNIPLAVTIRRTKTTDGAEWTRIEFAAVADQATCCEDVVETPRHILEALGEAQLGL